VAPLRISPAKQVAASPARPTNTASARIQSLQQFLQMLGIGPNGSGCRLASSSLRTEGGSERSVG
jgi:hypothetical protein